MALHRHRRAGLHSNYVSPNQIQSRRSPGDEHGDFGKPELDGENTSIPATRRPVRAVSEPENNARRNTQLVFPIIPAAELENAPRSNTEVGLATTVQELEDNSRNHTRTEPPIAVSELEGNSGSNRDCSRPNDIALPQQQVICAIPPDLNSGVGGGYSMAVPIAGQQQDNQQQHLVLQTGSITTPEGHAELSSEREPQELPADDRRRDG